MTTPVQVCLPEVPWGRLAVLLIVAVFVIALVVVTGDAGVASGLAVAAVSAATAFAGRNRV